MKKLTLILISAYIYCFAIDAQMYQTVSDVDGNIYNTIEIGNQLWMKENLKTSKYNDGTSITNITDNIVWKAGGAAYCWYNNDYSTYGTVYGALYNWYAVDTISNNGKNVCPIGWHVPTDNDWTILINYLGGDSIAGGKMKEIGTTHWKSPNTGATNESGFTGLPGLYRNGTDGLFIGNSVGTWWSSTEDDANHARNRYIWYPNAIAYMSYDVKQNGLSIRCISDSTKPLQPIVNIDSGLIAYYPFNGNANDKSGNGHDGIVEGATLTVDRFGNPNSAYYFNGSNIIELSHTDTLNFKNQHFTLIAWTLKENKTPTAYMHIISKGEGGIEAGYLISLGKFPAACGEKQ
jgi:uncharacterized protein (TIGR02145 family)